MKAIDLAVANILPPALRTRDRQYDKRSLDVLLSEVARDYPSEYPRVLKSLSDLGREASFVQGETLKLDDFRPVLDKDLALANMDREVAISDRTAKSPAEAQRKKIGIWSKYSDNLEAATQSEALRQGNNLGHTVISGARGNATQLKALITGPSLYVDFKDRIIPLFMRHSFSEGLRPAEYLASSYGTRRSVIQTKSATAQFGDILKQWNAATAPIIVTKDDCGTSNGLGMDTSEPDIYGRVLARSYGELKAGETLNRRELSSLKKKGIDKVIVRSPMTCQAKEGICSHCLGQLPGGHFARVGYAAGITASSGVGEPLCLHEDTLVRMADFSTKKIKDIKPGDMVLGSDMEGYLTPTRVVNVFHNGLRDCVRTKVKKGHGKGSELIEMVSTTAHKVLSVKGKLIKGKSPSIMPIERVASKWDQHSLFLNKEIVGDVGVREPMAALLGLLTGNGCYNGGVGSGGIGFSCYEKIQEEWLRDHLLQFDMMLVPQHTPGEFRVSMRDQYSSFQTIDGKLVRNIVKAKLMQEKMWGQRSGEKTLPATIWSWDNKSVAAYIGGCITTDGHITSNPDDPQYLNIEFSSNSKILLEGIKALLEIRFGIYGNRICHSIKKRPEGGFYDPNYKFIVSGKPNTTAIEKLIPIPGIKQSRLSDAVRNFTNSYLVRGRYKVMSQEPIGRLDTWDIEVENETHLFALANGMIVSNTQGALHSKHLSGAFKGTKKQFTGYEVIRQLIQSPETFPHKAATSEVPGRVESIEDAPQGGKFITVEGVKHYALPGYEPLVKPGDKVEAGEQMSEGIMDVADIVRLRGLGEGRKYYVDRLKQALEESGGGKVGRTNLELLARASIDHARIESPEGLGDLLPDDIASYNTLSSNYSPPKDTKLTPVEHTHGKYLQAPVLHFSIGTKLTPKMTAQIKDAGVDHVPVSEGPPPFEPEMVRLRAVTHNNPDWFARLHGSYLGTNLQESALRSRDTDTNSNIHFAPRLARGEHFGEKLETTGKF